MSDGMQAWGMDADRSVRPPRPASFGHRLFGGPPLAVAIRLCFVSLVVGAVLMWLGIEPADVFGALVNAVRHIWAMGFEALGQLGRYFVAGAAIVVPLWLLARLFGGRGAR